MLYCFLGGNAGVMYLIVLFYVRCLCTWFLLLVLVVGLLLVCCLGASWLQVLPVGLIGCLVYGV